jgi:alpha-aminoadipate carrier protein LysW
VVRCPKCAVEIDVDEDEVEEGEILNCPECEAELEVVQTHPVHLNVFSEDDEDEDEEKEEAKGDGENGVAQDDALDDEEEEIE